MKKLGLFMMFAAAMVLSACNNLGDDWDDKFGDDDDNTGGNTGTEQVDPAGAGTEADPYNVAKALTVQDGSMAWVKGYIVGQIAGDINVADDVQFSAPFKGATYDDGTVATAGTNILVAADANETAILKCLVVQLPKGDVRSTLELVNNPDNDGKPVELYGKLTKYFGVAGLKETAAAKFDGTTIGQVPEGPTTPPANAEGDGSENNPYNIAAAMANQNGAVAWVKGFIVGHVAGSSISSESQFDAPFTGAVYDDGSVATQGTNILIAATATENNPSACFVVQLPKGDVRTALDLLAHPEIDGKEVVVYGKLTKYFGTCGIKNTTCAIIDGTVYGVEPSDEPADNTEAILSISFTAGLGDFTAYSVSGDQVWMSDKTYGAKMSGYADGASHANEDWLISPALDLAGKSDVSISYEHAINKGDLNNLMTNHTMWMSDNYNGGDPATATWTQVEIVAYPDGKSWTYVPSGAIAVPAEYLKSNVRFAFKYLCSDKESATWEVRNLVVK